MKKTAFQFDVRTGDFVGAVALEPDDDALRGRQNAVRIDVLLLPTIALNEAKEALLAAEGDADRIVTAEAMVAAAEAEIERARAVAEIAASAVEPDAWLLPNDATLIAPPEPRIGYGNKWDGEEWLSLKDHRGEIWYSTDGMGWMINHLGQEVEFGAMVEGGLSPTRPAGASEREAAELVRGDRDARLSESDKLVWPDRWAGYTDEKRAAVTAYRESLRDVPKQEEFPTNVIWPDLPALT